MADGRFRPLAGWFRVDNVSGMRDFRKIVAWQRADQLVDMTYDITDALPVEERYGLAAQMKRAVVSIASNIAEGAGRASDADFERFLSMAAGSASEIQYQLGFVGRRWPRIEGSAEAMQLAHEVKRMIWALHQASRSRRP